MSRIEIREERCKGCLLCTQVCPQTILVQSSRFNVQGYKVVEMSVEEKDRCVGCAFCAQICPDYAITVYRTKKQGKTNG